MADTTKHQPLVDECKTIAEDCLYTAQAHYIMAARASWQAKLFLLVPAGVAAIAGILTSVGLPGWVGAFAAAAGLVNAVAAWLGPDQSSTAHRSAANLFTCLRHEARALAEVFQHSLTEAQLLAEVHRLSDHYNTLVATTEATDNKAYEAGRKRIKSGTFTPDFRENTKVEAQ